MQVSKFLKIKNRNNSCLVGAEGGGGGIGGWGGLEEEEQIC